MSASSVLRATSTQLAALKSIATCELSDALLKLPLPSGGQRGISPHGGFLADLASFGKQTAFVGEAFTVQMVDGADKDAPKPAGHYIDLCTADSVMVIARPPGSSMPKSAFLGGLLATGLAVKKVGGVIIDGRCRDLAELRGSLPVLAKGHTTLGQSPFTRPSAVQVPVSWAESDIIINPFDVIVADEDGVVVVRPVMLEQVLEAVRRGKEADAKSMADIASGRAVAETFAEHRAKK